MEEEIDITHGKRGRDKIKGIKETYNKVIVHYEKAGQVRDIEIPIEMVDFVGELIKQMEFGENHHSKYIYNKCIENFGIKSEIVKSKMDKIKSVLVDRKLPQSIVDSVIRELTDDTEFMQMTFEELIGLRTGESMYFKIYGCIKYFEEKDKINYNKRGYIMRLE